MGGVGRITPGERVSASKRIAGFKRLRQVALRSNKLNTPTYFSRRVRFLEALTTSVLRDGATLHDWSVVLTSLGVSSERFREWYCRCVTGLATFDIFYATFTHHRFALPPEGRGIAKGPPAGVNPLLGLWRSPVLHRKSFDHGSAAGLREVWTFGVRTVVFSHRELATPAPRFPWVETPRGGRGVSLVFLFLLTPDGRTDIGDRGGLEESNNHTIHNNNGAQARGARAPNHTTLMCGPRRG